MKIILIYIFLSIIVTIFSCRWFYIINKKVKRYICPECGEERPDDDRVKQGMKCRHCAYWGQNETSNKFLSNKIIYHREVYFILIGGLNERK